MLTQAHYLISHSHIHFWRILKVCRCHRKSDPGLYLSGRIESASGINPSDRIGGIGSRIGCDTGKSCSDNDATSILASRETLLQREERGKPLLYFCVKNESQVILLFSTTLGLFRSFHFVAFRVLLLPSFQPLPPSR